MCGILGWLGPERQPIDPARWSSALTALSHRGPDGSGSWSGRFAGAPEPIAVKLGHTRLAILDTSNAAAQPMVSPQTGICLVFNGQIFNFRELRNELSGFPWKGHGDTEVLLAALDRWGVDAVARLRGMFAFAWWDPRSGIVGLARDRLGVKPLYFAPHASGLSWGSETRAVGRLMPAAPALSPEGLRDFITWGSTQEPHTIWEGISALPPGSVAVVRAGRMTVARYWRASSFVGRHRHGPPENLVAHVEKAVSMRLVSDVPLGVFLSSGVDSAIIAHQAHRGAPGLRGLTLAFSGDASSEAAGASAMARRLGIAQDLVEYQPDEVPGLFGDFVKSQDQPSIDGLNTWLISRAARSAGYKVMLSGLGGDELFFGYSIYKQARLGLFSPRPRWPPLLRHLIRGAEPRRDRLRAIVGAPTFLRGAQWIRAIWGPDYLGQMGLLPAPPIAAEEGALAGEPVENQLSWFDLTHYLSNTLLRDSDVMSMSQGLELRVPFMDHELVEHAVGLSAGEKWGPNGQPKHLLRQHFSEAIGPEVFARPKMGFNLPYGRWLRTELKDLVASSIEVLSQRRILPDAHLREVADRFARRPGDWAALYQVAVLGRWVANNAP